MKQKEAIKKIVLTLLEESETINLYTKREVENAIIVNRGVDPRTVNHWFDALWRLGYITQPRPEKYTLSLSKLAELEIRTHTQISRQHP